MAYSGLLGMVYEEQEICLQDGKMLDKGYIILIRNPKSKACFNE